MDIQKHLEEQTDLLFEMIKQVKAFANDPKLFGEFDPAYALQKRNEAAYKYNAILAKLQNLPIQEVKVIGDLKLNRPNNQPEPLNLVQLAEQVCEWHPDHPLN